MNFKELYPELTHTFGNMLNSLDGKMSYFKTAPNQRWYVWKPKQAISVLEDVLNEAKVNDDGELYFDTNYAIGSITISVVCVGNGVYQLDIAEGQQRTTTYVLIVKAISDLITFMNCTDNACLKTKMKALDQISFTKNDENFCKLKLHNNLDDGELQKIIAFDPAGKMPKGLDEAAQMIGVRKDSNLLNVYFELMHAIYKIVKKGHDGKSFDINDVFMAVNKLGVSIHYCQDRFAQKFSSTNENLVKMAKYHLLCNEFGGIIDSNVVAQYCDRVDNSIPFRNNCDKFVQIISVHDARIKTSTPKLETVMAHYKSCYKRLSGTSLEGNVGIYEGFAKQIFELYGGVYVDMLELNDSIPKDVQLLLMEMKALFKNLWQIVAMGCVKLLIEEDVTTINELSEDSLNVIRNMFQAFIVYGMMRNFTIVKEVSATLEFVKFFANNEYTNSDIVAKFKRFLSADINVKAAMPNAEDMLKAMVTKSIDDAASRFILMNIESYINPYGLSVQQLVDEQYQNEHIAPESDSKTKHYELNQEQRKCFANASLLRPDENQLAANDKIEVKDENVYQKSPLCLNNVSVVGKKMKSNRGALSANYYVRGKKKNTVLGQDYLETRGRAFIEVLFEIKEKTFGK